MERILSQRKKTVRLTIRDATLGDVFSDIARMHLDHRPSAKAGKIVLIRSGNKKAYAVARGLAKGMSKDEISIDSAMRERLEVKVNQSYELVVERAGVVGEVRWAWGSTDAMPRVAARLGAISVGLGAVGLLLGALSFLPR